MKRMIQAAKQLGSQVAKKFASLRTLTKQSQETKSKKHVIANEVKQSQETKSFVKEITSVIAFPRNDVSKIAAAVVLGVIITTTVVAKPYNCIPCKENNYCIKGIRYECPLDKPVTQGNRKTSEDDCMTCIQRNGDETNPVYDITRDDCVSCYEYNSETPILASSSAVIIPI